jgi:hypothetical protein
VVRCAFLASWDIEMVWGMEGGDEEAVSFLVPVLPFFKVEKGFCCILGLMSNADVTFWR